MADGVTLTMVRGDIAKARAALQKQTRKKVRGELRKIISEASKSVRKEIRQAALDELPKQGGLNEWAAVLPRAAVTDRGGKVGVKITASKSGHDLAALDEGTFRHPLYGNQSSWHLQSIPGGFFTRTIDRNRPELVLSVRQGVDRYIANIAKDAS